MTTHPLYPHGRASAPSPGMGSIHPGDHVGRADYEMIEHLHAARQTGDEAMTAVEEYDPDFSLKLSACTTTDDAERLLDGWLSHRVDVLKRTQAELRRVWQEARKPPGTAPG